MPGHITKSQRTCLGRYGSSPPATPARVMGEDLGVLAFKDTWVRDAAVLLGVSVQAGGWVFPSNPVLPSLLLKAEEIVLISEPH